ncbi:MAG: YgeY family selenium metabolism-linked hydrolase [Acidimicrobiales bacterium]
MTSVASPVETSSLPLARELAMTPSVSGNEEAAVRLVAAAMTDAGFDTVEIDAVGNAVGIVGSGSGPRVLIDGHIDSIPLHSAERWSVDPFGGLIRDGNLYGLGICDQKASIAAAVHGVAEAHLQGRLGGQVAVVASVCEEEMEGQALLSVLSAFNPDVVITSEPNDTRLAIGQRGRAKIEVTVVGRACHAGHAREGLNAVEALTALVEEARRLDHPVHPDLGHRDLTCIDFASWPYPSVSTVPGRAMARFDCRFLPGETPESLVALLEGCAMRAWKDWTERPSLEVRLVRATFTTWTGTAFDAAEFCHAWWTDAHSQPVTRAQAALAEIGLDPSPTHYSFCTNGSLSAGVLGIATLGFGVGVESGAHQVDEHVSLESLAAGQRGYAALATHLSAGR